MLKQLQGRRRRKADRLEQERQTERENEERQTARENEERLRRRIAQQWAARAARQPSPPQGSTVEVGTSNFSRGEVPYGVDLAAAWAWRFIVIVIAGLMVLWTLRYFSLVVLPIFIALFLAALLHPLVDLLERVGIRRKLGALIVVVVTIALIALLIFFVSAQISAGINNLSGQVVDGLEEIRKWLRTGPLHVSDSQINNFIQQAQQLISDKGKSLAGKATEVATSVTDIVAGFFIVLFSTYFFLADGALIWAWIVRLFPRAARRRADSSGRIAFHSLTNFVRATVLVAATDASGVMIWAAVLGLPFISAIGVLVFLGAFIPLIGATLSGTVAILVALVAKGPVTALIMLGGVVVVQQIEAHILQPFLMGRFVSVHPLGVIFSIAAGVSVAGIVGALIAVPLAASLNAVVQHLATYTDPGENALEAAAEDPAPDPQLAVDAAEEGVDGGPTPAPSDGVQDG